MANTDTAKATLQEIEGPAFVDIETVLDLSNLSREAPTRRVARVVEKAAELKEAVKVGMRDFEEGWLQSGWQGENLYPSQSFDALDAPPAQTLT